MTTASLSLARPSSSSSMTEALIPLSALPDKAAQPSHGTSFVFPPPKTTLRSTQTLSHRRSHPQTARLKAFDSRPSIPMSNRYESGLPLAHYHLHAPVALNLALLPDVRAVRYVKHTILHQHGEHILHQNRRINSAITLLLIPRRRRQRNAFPPSDTPPLTLAHHSHPMNLTATTPTVSSFERRDPYVKMIPLYLNSPTSKSLDWLPGSRVVRSGLVLRCLVVGRSMVRGVGAIVPSRIVRKARQMNSRSPSNALVPVPVLHQGARSSGLENCSLL